MNSGTTVKSAHDEARDDAYQHYKHNELSKIAYIAKEYSTSLDNPIGEDREFCYALTSLLMDYTEIPNIFEYSDVNQPDPNDDDYMADGTDK